MAAAEAFRPYQNPRIDGKPMRSDGAVGRVRPDVGKIVWVGSMLVGTVAGIVGFAQVGAISLFVVFTGVTLCLGHSLGMHRRLIHRSYDCPRWLEYLFVHLGVLVGLAGPLGMLRVHDLRDWSQRQRACHAYFSHASVWYRDLYWQVFCSISLDRPPHIDIEPEIAGDPVYRFMERHWMLQQLPWAALFFVIGGVGWVLWGICARVVVSILGHWFIGYFAHNRGEQDWHVQDAAVQGYNVRWSALLTMGECWHNNHHAYPGSARLGLEPGQWDPGWWVLRALERARLVWNLRLPADLPERTDLMRLV